MKTILIWASSVILGLVIGALSALWMGGILPGSPKLGNALEINGWVSDWSIGSESANPYVRARVARNGLLGLAKEEAVYFIKREDDDGARLRETCIYRVSGGKFSADWWSITLYDNENRLPMNSDGKLSLDQTQTDLVFDIADQWWFDVAAKAPDDRTALWVSSRGAGEFDLTLRLYRPSGALLAAPERVLVPPSVERVSCAEVTS